MGWQGAVVAAIGAAQYKQQGAIGKYNLAVSERSAKVLENQAEAIEKKKEFDIAQFDKNFRKVQGQTKVALAKSGVVQGSGTAYRIQMANAMEAELQKQLIAYNAKVQADKKLEEAKFAIIQGNIAKQQARLEQIKTLSSVGTSLLTMNKGTA
tara:strand:- start:350 stop:808 length:459 start_codon:yes stop_codon:yes gene_type:complete